MTTFHFQWRYGRKLFVFAAKVVAVVIIAMARRAAATSSSTLVYHVSEELPGGTFVGNVKNDSTGLRHHPPEVLAQLEFTLQRSSGVYAFFRLDQKTGVLTTARPLDREAILPDTNIELSIRVMPRNYFSIIKVMVVVDDINDNSPHFPEPQVALVVPETTRPGALFALPSAEDVDGGRYGVRTYELYSVEAGFTSPVASATFGLRLANHSDGSMDVKLLLQSALDYEQRTSYKLMLMALDGGTPPLSGTLEISITLTDANDNAPHFAKAQYEVSVPENTRPGTPLVLLSATDNDQGLNGRVSYLLDPNPTGRDAALFRVDNVTGAVLLAGPLDYEKSHVHMISVVARDGGAQPQSAFARVVISVDDVNDVAPIVAFSTMQQQATPLIRNRDEGNIGSHGNSGEGTQARAVVEVMENLPSGTFVAQMTATDADTGDGGKVACHVASDNDRFFSLQKISSDDMDGEGKVVEYRIVTNVQLDRESQEAYRVRIVCKDDGQPRLTSTSTLAVNVADQNDNAPFFLRQVYHVMLAENNAIGDIVVGMNASDLDVDTNARLTYSIAPLERNIRHAHTHGSHSRDLLSIDSRTGVVRALVKFDYESAADREGYLFRVTVMDSGDPVRSAVTTLNLTIQDVNDEYPVFKEERYLFFVKENTPPPCDVGVIEAIDGDGPRYSQIVYSIHHQDGDHSGVGSGGRRFAIDAYTGRVVTIRPLDREVLATHTFVVQASNPIVGSSGSIGREDATIASFVNVTVIVQDENDNAPVFRNPSPVNSTVVVRNDAPVGYVITRLLAIDPDMGGGRTVAYAIVSGNDDGNFHVDAVNGELTTTRFLTSYVNNILKLTVSAQDGETPPRVTLTTLYVHVAQRGSAAVKSFDEQHHQHQQLQQQDDDALIASQQSTHLTFTIVVVIGVLGGLLVIAVSSIVLAVLCLNARRQRQRLRTEREAKKSAEEAAALLLKVATDERQRAAAAGGAASPARSLLWNSACQPDDTDTMDILRDLPVFSGGLRMTCQRDTCHQGRQCCGGGGGGPVGRRHGHHTVTHCHAGSALYAQRENLSLPCLLPVPRRCHYCVGPHTRSQGSCDNDFDMFSEDGSITDSGRGGSEQGEHLNPGSARPFLDNPFPALSSSPPSPSAAQGSPEQQNPLPSDDVTRSKSPTQKSPSDNQSQSLETQKVPSKYRRTTGPRSHSQTSGKLSTPVSLYVTAIHTIHAQLTIYMRGSP